MDQTASTLPAPILNTDIQIVEDHNAITYKYYAMKIMQGSTLSVN